MKNISRKIAAMVLLGSVLLYGSGAAQIMEPLDPVGLHDKKALVDKELEGLLNLLDGGRESIFPKPVEAFGLKLQQVRNNWKLLCKDTDITAAKAAYVVYEGYLNSAKQNVQVVFGLLPKKGWETMLSRENTVSFIKIGTGVIDGHAVTLYYQKEEKAVVLVFEDLSYVMDPRDKNGVAPMYVTVSLRGLFPSGDTYVVQHVLETSVQPLFSTLSVTGENTFGTETTERRSPLMLKYQPAPLRQINVTEKYALAGQLQGDIDHDGKMETVGWKQTAGSELGDFYQLIVFDDDSSVLWKGPSEADDTNPLIFFLLDTGESLPQVLTDFDLDGNSELLAPMAQSDVSPTYYRKLRWRGGYFEPLLQNALMLKRGSSSRFVWKTVFKPDGVWISKMAPAKHGLIKAEITRMTQEGEVYGGEALIKFVHGGAVIKKILKPLAKFGDDSASTTDTDTAATDTYTAPSTRATAPVVSNPQAYRARISHGDHYNSRGVKLRSLAAVLRQDRANYYKYGGDAEDQRDRYFSTIGNRAAMERIPIHPVGLSYRALRDTVLYGTPLLEIEVESRQLNVRVIER